MNKKPEEPVKFLTRKQWILILSLLGASGGIVLTAGGYFLWKFMEQSAVNFEKINPAPANISVSALPEQTNRCSFSDIALPSDMVVVATGAYSGKVLNYQIDQSGHQATQFDIDIHSDKPIALIFGAYEPSVWNLRWTANTAIKAVYVTGYHRQVVAGIPPGVPVINSSFANRSSCGYNYIGADANSLSWVNPKSMNVFGSKVQRVYPGTGGNVFINESNGDSVVKSNYSFITYEQNKPESYFDKTAPLAGNAGLQDAVEKGIIRPITPADISLVRAHYERIAKQSFYGNSVPPIAGKTTNETVAVNMPNLFNGYAVFKPFNIPAGLYGAHSASFVVMPGVEYPKGEPGHSIIIDLNDNVNPCAGPLCNR